ncbi:MAG TPA: LemA family protein [Syntrophales bacterium]|nr:LemA family protein [Syntrophales bacterium]
MYMIIAVIVVLIIIVAVMYNRFIRSRNLLNEAWSGIDVQLKRRHDLIPNVVETVKGYAQHERKAFEEITRLRSKMTDPSMTVKETGKLESSFTQALKSIFALAEAYPDLKANQNFIELQKTLAGVEEQLQLARRYYNGTARDYNIMVESFPNNILASLFHFTKAEYFEIELATERETPELKFT